MFNMPSPSDESSSDDEIEHLADIASRNVYECSDTEIIDIDSTTTESDDDLESDSPNLKHGDGENALNDAPFTIDMTLPYHNESGKQETISLNEEIGLKSTAVNNKSQTKKRNNRPTTHKTIEQNNEFKLASEIGVGLKLPGIYINVKPWVNPSKKMKEFSKLKRNSLNKDLKVMEKSIITADFVKTEYLPKYHESVRNVKRERKKLCDMTKGKQWFDLPATDLTEENKNSLMVLQMRKALDPKRFYKSNDLKDFPKYCQFGTIIEGAAEFYSARIPKKQRKKTVVDELLADAEFRTFNKRKFEEIQSSKRRGTGTYEGSKRMINKKKGPMHRQPEKRQKKFFIDSSAFSKVKHRRK